MIVAYYCCLWFLAVVVHVPTLQEFQHALFRFLVGRVGIGAQFGELGFVARQDGTAAGHGPNQWFTVGAAMDQCLSGME